MTKKSKRQVNPSYHSDITVVILMYSLLTFPLGDLTGYTCMSEKGLNFSSCMLTGSLPQYNVCQWKENSGILLLRVKTAVFMYSYWLSLFTFSGSQEGGQMHVQLIALQDSSTKGTWVFYKALTCLPFTLEGYPIAQSSKHVYQREIPLLLQD